MSTTQRHDVPSDATPKEMLQAGIAGNVHALWAAAGRTEPMPTYRTNAQREAFRREYDKTMRLEIERAARGAAAPTPDAIVHILSTFGEPTGEHYDATQCDDAISDGHVLIVGRTVAILDRACPVAIVGPCGAFHAPAGVVDAAWIQSTDDERARHGRGPIGPTIRRILAGEFGPTDNGPTDNGPAPAPTTGGPDTGAARAPRTSAATGAARKPIAHGSFVVHVAEPGRLGIVDGTCEPADYVPVLWTDGTHSIESRAVLRAVRAPLGFILYEGPSMIDGAPIVAVVNAIDASGNSKTGNLVQSFIIRSDVGPVDAVRTGADASVCGQCPHRPALVAAAIASAVASGASIDAARAAAPARCYVNVGRAPLGVHGAYRRGRYVRASAAFIAEALRDRRVRLGTYGDPAAVPVELWRAIVEHAAGHNGYSHQWASIDAAAWAPLVMASVDSVDEQRDAAARGFRTFRVSVDASDLMRGTEAVCPASAEGGRRAQCADCMLCGGSSRAARSIRIIDHASGWKRRVINIAAA